MKNRYLILFLLISTALYITNILFSCYFAKENVIVDAKETKIASSPALHDKIQNHETKSVEKIKVKDRAYFDLDERGKVISIPIDASGSDIIPLYQ